jgi:hypothetical protein
MPFTLGDPTQTSPEIHVGDVGTRFIVTVYNQNSQLIDLGIATSLTIRFRNPSGVSSDKTAVLYTNGSDGKLMYELEAGDIDIAGTWKYQAIIEFAGGTWHTNVTNFIVYENIAEPVVI